MTKSPWASETLALSEGADAGFLVSSLVQEIFNLPSLPLVKCFTDNRSLTDTLVTTRVIRIEGRLMCFILYNILRGVGLK